MTRKEMITACIENQIERGIIKAENKEKQIKSRLTGSYKMSWSDCKRWYGSVFASEEQSPNGYTLASECGNIILEANFASI